MFSVPGEKYGEFELPCGQCIGCKLERSRQWAVRCMHENVMHDFSSYITLTFNDDHAPWDGSLDYKVFQRFLKRARKKLGKFRYYMCGEYGGENGRPHYHAILFGVYFPDRVFDRTSPSGCNLYRSPTLESLWPFGFSSVGDVTFESAAYVARYCTKKVTGDPSFMHYLRELDDGTRIYLTPEFGHMSLKPGIGIPFFNKYRDEILDNGSVVMRGVEMKAPKAYDRLVHGVDPRQDDIEYSRYLKGLDMRDDCTAERLAVQEVVAKARSDFKKRSL